MDDFKKTISVVARKPIVAAALSFLFPGLGQAAAGDRNRGLIVSIPMFGVLGAFLLILIFDRGSLFGLAVNQQWLTSLLVLDLVAFIYHMWAVVDSYLVATKAQSRGRRSNAPTTKWAAVLGICLIVMGTVAIHGSIAKVDMDWQHALYCLTAKTPCWVTDNSVVIDPNASDNGDNGNGIGDPVITPGSSGAHGSASPGATYDLSNLQTFSTTADSQNWAADGQLNVLLMGLGVQKGSSAGQLGPDTIMVLHVGINTGQAELISIGRNEYCVPLPTQEIAAHYPQTNFYSGTNCPAGTFPQGMWALPNEILGHCDRWPIPEYQSTCGQAGDPNRYPRAYKGTEMTIGNLLGMHIDGSMWINPAGLSTLIDALSGVDIKVTTTLSDGPCGYTGDANYNLGSESAFSAIGRPYCPDSTHTGYFVPTGLTGIQHMKDQADASNGGLTLIQVPGHPYDVAFIMKPGTYHMNGEWALAYARTRIYSSDSSRSARQQGVLAALRKDLDPCHFANVGNVLQVLGALQSIPQGFNTDLGIEDGSNLQAWAGLAKKVLSPTTQQQLVLTQSNTNQGAVQLSKDTTHPSWWPAFGPTSVQNAQQLVQQHFVTSTGSSGSGGSSC